MNRIFYILFFFMLVSIMACSSDNPVDEHTDTNTQQLSNTQISPDTQQITQNNNQKKNTASSTPNTLIFNILQQVNEKYLIKPIKNYLQGNSDVILIKNSQNYAEFVHYNNQIQMHIDIQYLNTDKIKDMLAVSFYIDSADGFVNYFYFLQKFNGQWSNVTQLIITNEIIYNLSEGLDTKFSYQPFDNVYSYKSGLSKMALSFDFSDEPQIKVFDGNNWETAILLYFSEGIFHINKNKTAGTKNSNLLDEEELEKARVFYDLKSAISVKNYAFVLDLADNGLDNIPENIDQLLNLQTLILNDNDISKLPEFILSLKNIQILRINNNNLTELPANINELSNLKELSVSNNNLHYIPTSLALMQNLEVLNLDNNNISSFVIDCSNLKKLVILNLSSNQIKKLPASIKELKNLISLDLSNNPIEYLPVGIYELPNLSYIDVRNTKIPDEQILKLWDYNPDLTIMMN